MLNEGSVTWVVIFEVGEDLDEVPLGEGAVDLDLVLLVD